MNQTTNEIDWSLTSWEGSRRVQLRRACRLTLRERLIALDDMQEFADHFLKQRKKRNLPIVEADQT